MGSFPSAEVKEPSAGRPTNHAAFGSLDSKETAVAPTFATPGVYIQETSAFPHSITGVATAVPAFVGYTEKAVFKGVKLTNRPQRISSLVEFHEIFGGGPSGAVRFKLVKGAVADRSLATPLAARDAEPVVLGGHPYTLTQASGFYMLYATMQLFFQNNGAACYVVSVGGYATADGPQIDKNQLIAGIAALEKEQEPTLLALPDAVLLDQAACIEVQQEALRHCGEVMKNRFAILDVWEGYRDRNAAPDCVAEFRNRLGANWLSYGAAYYPWLNTTVVPRAGLSWANVAPASRDALIVSIKDEFATMGLAADRLNAALKMIDELDVLAAEQHDDITRLTSALTAVSPFFKSVLDEICRRLNMLPPSAAMAGIFTMVDNTRGVWKAPANVSVSGVVSPCVAISAAQQEDLNVTPQGKSINAIRAFAGEGVLVWGARTLDGNSLDYRYINVRRTLIMLEESIRLACKAMVFEPNAANTWVTARGMIENFLLTLWKQGCLAGAAPQDAFSVLVGAGQTMTQQDLDEGIMRVTVLVALARPAEFIEITLQQTMQKS
jgi:uncharacterized protein